MKKYVVLFLLSFWILSGSSRAEIPRGIFGLPSLRESHPSGYLPLLRKANVNGVFVPEDRETLRFFKTHGFETFISVNVFGGKGAWEKYPDSRPVKADGHLLGSEQDYKGYGGVCPTHPLWRKERWARIGDLVQGSEGLDGIWLDFIRYPGLWEVPDPRIPDTCYCKRCLQRFREESRSDLPDGIDAKGAAIWIKEHASYDWMIWKKKQISSFVLETRKILDRASTNRSLKLGLFLVPWTKGERENAISYKMAQDAFDLSGLVDVISPMVYHKMCGRPETWVGYMTRYYRETARCQVWPIVQSIDCRPEEFSQALQSSGKAGADGILVYSFKGMTPELWPGLQAFQRPENLIPNPDLQIPEGEHRPAGWDTGKMLEGEVQKSLFPVKPSHQFQTKDIPSLPGGSSRCIGVTAGHDRAGVWFSRLPEGEPGTEYLFTGRLYRDRWRNGVYPSIGIWGEEFLVNTHWLTRRFQPIRLHVTCPGKVQDTTFRFINHNPEETLWLTQPRLTKNHEFEWPMNKKEVPPVFFKQDFFPIGVYGADISRLEEIKGLGLNTVLIGGRGEGLQKTLAKCHELGLRYVLSTPHDPDRLPPFLDEISGGIRPHEAAFYVNDEPGIHSFPINKAEDINRVIKERFPEAATCMAIVRPQVCRDYRGATDFFMLDQYPVPYMPMTWLSDSMDEAGKEVGMNRLASVLQAFGGERWDGAGWPRLPTWQEMDCLAFLSVIHGSRAILFFTFSEIGKTEEGRKRLGRVVGRLNRVYPWLVEKNLDPKIEVDMVSPHRSDPRGRPAVHACLKKKGNQKLIISTNTIGTYTEAVISLKATGMNEIKECQEVFSGTSYPVMDGGIRAKFGPFETKAFLLSKMQDS